MQWDSPLEPPAVVDRQPSEAAEQPFVECRELAFWDQPTSSPKLVWQPSVPFPFPRRGSDILGSFSPSAVRASDISLRKRD